MLNEEIQAIAKESVLCWLATVSSEGEPNVSPKEIWEIFHSKYIVVANIASPISAKNIEATSKACISFINLFSQKGFKVAGECRNVGRESAEFGRFAKNLVLLAEPRFLVRSVFVLEPSSVTPILAPSYTFYPSEVSEESQIAAAMREYGVKPST